MIPRNSMTAVRRPEGRAGRPSQSLAGGRR